MLFLFRIFPKYGIDSFQAIMSNYFVAALLGYVISAQPFNVSFIVSQPWLLPATFLGLLFVSMFYLVALTTNVFGISVTAVSNKMSVVIPVTAAVILYNDHINSIKMMGILLALGAVVLVSIKSEKSAIHVTKKWQYLLPVILFVGCGSIDMLVNYLQSKFVTNAISNEYILSTSFLIAGILGSSAFLLLIFANKIKADLKSILVGFALGVPNFFCMYLVMKSLETNIMPASVFFPVNNISIVILSTLVSVVLFREKLSNKNIVGVVLSILAIILIAKF